MNTTEKAMPVAFNPARQRPANLSATVERLLAEFVPQQQQAPYGRQQLADASQVRHLLAKIPDFPPQPTNRFNHLRQFLSLK